MNTRKTLSRDSFKNQKVLVFGFGVHGGGLGTVEFLLSTEVARIVITDMKTREELENTLTQLPLDNRIEWRLGGHDENDFKQADIVIKNPAIKWDNPYILRARESGARILMDASIFFSLCTAPIIGVTGSKGKTTTTSALTHILASAGKKIVPVGVSQVGVLSELPKITEESIVVFELSSWRLSGLREIEKSPAIAIITNLYPDHLNYYPDIETYAEDKAEIFLWQDTTGVLILPHNSEWTEWFGTQAPGRILSFGFNNEREAWQDADSLWIKEGERSVKLIDKKELLIHGEYNFDNLLAATLGALQVGLTPLEVSEGLQTFAGIPHRFELVREVDGIRYINDTTATIPSAALASVRSVEGRVLLLAGGSDKGLPLDELVQAIEHAKYTVLFSGSSTDKLQQMLAPALKEKTEEVGSMEEAVQVARKHAEAGDCVLLAPGAASFGMFRNEFDRGEQFRAMVLAL